MENDMSEEIDNTEVEDTDDLYDLLKLPRPDADEYEDEQDEQDEEISKQSKMEKKLSAKMDEMQKKLEGSLVRERINKFQEGADDLQKDLFRTVAADVKDVESLDEALKLVDSQAKKMQEHADKYRAELEKKAQEQVSQAWGTGPMGTPTPHTQDYEEKLLEKVRAGDSAAAFELIIGDDWPSL
jgi:uncharacterized coiled-coil DUF342 family protein